MVKLRFIVASALLCVLPGALIITAQTNLLINPNADFGIEGWRAHGKATVEEFNGNKVFVVRQDDNDQIYSFTQIVNLAKSDIGKYALLIGLGSSERINADAAITGLPYLYGYMLKVNNPNGGIINAYLQGQQMLARSSQSNKWVVMWGIFRVPESTVGIQFFLMQAARKYVPPNGSAARFDDLGLYLFESEEGAVQFVDTYKGSMRK